jgi:hypothetical protein
MGEQKLIYLQIPWMYKGRPDREFLPVQEWEYYEQSEFASSLTLTLPHCLLPSPFSNSIYISMEGGGGGEGSGREYSALINFVSIFSVKIAQFAWKFLYLRKREREGNYSAVSTFLQLRRS